MAKSSAAVKKAMRCGEVRHSTRPGKKVMKLYCTNGKKQLVHAGSRGYGNNYSAAARKSFKARHKCSTAKPGTARHLACTELWKGPTGRKTAPTKAHPGKR